MIKKLRLFLLSTITGLTLLAPAVAMPVLVHAQTIEEGLNCGTNLKFTTGKDCSGISGQSAEQKVNDIVELVINIFSIVVGIIAVIMIIVGGIKYILSGGDAGQASSARNTIIYAIVGLIIVALAQILVRYVLSRVNSGA